MGAVPSKGDHRLAGKHVLITGGSEGIGLALAKECLRKSANVTILARTQSKLSAALAELRIIRTEGSAESGRVDSCSADVTQPEQVQKAIAELLQQHGKIDVVICCAGKAYPGLFLEQDADVTQTTMQLNYFGTHNILRAVIPSMVQRNSGHAVIVSSGLALCGFLGYSSYAPSKWALRGLADCLRNELAWTNVKVSIGYPPDTDTPGYAEEQKLKPPGCEDVTRAMGSALSSPQQVAAAMIKSMEHGHYHLASPDLGQNLLMGSMAGISPRPYLYFAPFLGIILPLVFAYLRWTIDKVVRRTHRSASSPHDVQHAAQFNQGPSAGLLAKDS